MKTKKQTKTTFCHVPLTIATRETLMYLSQHNPMDHDSG